MKKALCVILLSILLVLGGCTAGTKKQEDADGLYVYFFQAGKADAILLYTDESAVLLDTGTAGYGSVILEKLEELGISELDALVITHFDQDHVGGAAEVIKGITVKTILQSDVPKDSDEYEAYTEALAECGINPVTVETTYSFTLDEVSYVIDGPDEVYEADQSNNSSLIMAVTCGEKRLLFMGDAENDRIKEFVKSDLAGTYDFLKVPHHGNWNKQTEKLITSVSPAYAVICCSAEEGGEQETLDLLEANSVKYYLTYKGAVLLHTDGKAITVSYE